MKRKVEDEPVPLGHEPSPEGMAALEQRIGHVFLDRALLLQALTHRSMPGMPDNERLEFLGDAVVGLHVAHILYHRFAEAGEGVLSLYRSEVVSTVALARLAQELGVGELLLMGRGEEQNGGRNKSSLLAGALEAILGAVCLDGGFLVARGVVEGLFAKVMSGFSEENARKGSKSLLQERLQSMGRALPEYRVVERSGPAHDPRFMVACRLDNDMEACAVGSSIRTAEAEAAREILDRLTAEEEMRDG